MRSVTHLPALMLFLACATAAAAGHRAAGDRAAGPPAGCGPDGTLSYICGPVASEDLVRIPHSAWLIASGMNIGQPAHLYLIDTLHKTSSVLFPSGKPGPAAGPAPDPMPGPAPDPQRTPGPPLTAACGSPPDLARMSLDGLALRAGARGIHTLYAANHGDRMAIEIFAVDARSARPRLRWMGCARLPPGTLPNAVTPLPDGGLLVISFYDPTDPHAWKRMAAGQHTGRILQWHAQRGFEAVANSATSGGNGIATSADGSLIYASSWSSRQLLVLSRRDGSRREIPLDFMPDNIHRLADGSLLVAGQRTTVAAIEACTGARCPQPWVIARVQPARGRLGADTVEQLLTGAGSAAIDYACGAIAVNGTLYITARGAQRIAYQAFTGRPYLDQ